MWKKAFIATLMVSLIYVGITRAGSQPSITITGDVENELELTLEDISRFESDAVRITEVSSDGSYHGTFRYKGPSLQTLLQIAGIRKKQTEYTKPIDLAVVVTNEKGQSASFAWGEIFYRNPSRIIVAIEGRPVMPHHSCQKCHQGEDYKPYYDQLLREVGFPKLVVEDDFYDDRCLEGITSIKIVDLAYSAPLENTGRGKGEEMYAPSFRIDGAVERPVSIEDISGHPRQDIRVKMIGDGKGYHGLSTVSGVPLVRLLDAAGISGSTQSVILVSAPDGYRALLSYGELYLSSSGERVIISDERKGHPLVDGGKFSLVVPSDLSIDRWVKSVDHIEVLSPLAR